MPLNTSIPNPDFPHYAMKLVAASRFEEAAIGAQILIVLEPYKIVDGLIVRPMKIVDGIEVVDDSLTVTESFGDAYVQAQTNPALATAIGSVLAAIQQYINATGR